MAPPKKPPAAASSPRKKGGKIPTRKDNVKSVAQLLVPTLSCYGFADEFPIEAYLYCRDDNNDAFCNGYKLFAEGKIDSDALSGANFTSFKIRRMPQSNNEIMKQGTTSYWRIVIVRYVLGGNSTAESRAEGLKVLKEFLMSKDNSEYPVADIKTLDCTKVDDPHSLDSFFMDKDIVDIVKKELHEDDLDKSFYLKFETFARKLWSGPNYPDFARDIGFP
jgi:hypothetical protein